MNPFANMSLTTILSIAVVLVTFFAGGYAITVYSDKLPDGTKCYFNTVCFVPISTIQALKSAEVNQAIKAVKK